MKVKVETTITLSDLEVACVKHEMKDLGYTDESLRDFIKSNCVIWAESYVTEQVSKYSDLIECGEDEGE